MISQNTFPTRFTTIDELTRRYYDKLTGEDECYFLGEFTTRKGYRYSETNRTIINFKKPMDRCGTLEWKYKQLAINECADAFAIALNPFSLDTMTFVPVPPSNMKNHELYDDRLVRMLKIVGEKVGVLRISECVEQTKPLRSSHDSTYALKPHELIDAYEFRNHRRTPRPTTIAIVDDVITTGAHFKAMESILLEQYPGINVIGLFLARAISLPPDLSHIFSDVSTSN